MFATFDMHQLGGGMIYVISILDNFSRAILSSAVSRTQDLTAYLMVLYAAIPQHGSPEALVSDGGTIFKAKEALRIYAALGITKEQIEKRQAWQSYIETHFNVQRRMADWHFAHAETWSELVASHDQFIADYNYQVHWAHRDRQDGRHSPAEVLGWVHGVQRDPAELMHIKIPNVDRPVLMPATGLEGHRFELMRRLRRLIEPVEAAIEREDTATGPWAELDTEMEQGGVDAELSQFRILLEPADHIHGTEVDLPSRVLGNRRFIFEACDALVNPAAERLVDAWPVRLKVGSDTGNRPPFRVKPDDGQFTLCGVGNLMPGLIAPGLKGRGRARGGNMLDAFMVRFSSVANVADLGDLPPAHGR